jgi:polyphosphate kinase 2 (PPK2 family)
MRTTPYEEWMPVEEEEDTIQKAEKVKMYISSRLETYNIYERTLATEHIMNQKSYSQISKEYNINRRFISETITPVKKDIFNKVKEKWNI